METKDLELKKILDKYEYASIAVLHATKDGINLLMTLGKQDIEEDIDVCEDTIYRIASISKVIVALGAMKLVEEGKLDIYEDVSKYLGFSLRNPNYPDKKITLEQIMTQSSSITDGFDDPDKGYDAVNGPSVYVPLKEILTNPDYEYYNPKTFLDAKPGEKWLYSNFGCGILACIIEKVSGKLFTDYIKEVLLDPLEIDGGFRVEQVKKLDKVASLYDYNDHGYKKLRTKDKFLEIMFPKYPIGDNFRGPAGGLFISAKDLSKIMIMMMNKGIYNGIRLFKEETILEMEKVHYDGYIYDRQYKAKGLQLCHLPFYTKEPMYGHFGTAYGLKSFMFYNRENGYIFMCGGSNYKQIPDRNISYLQNDVFEYLTKKFEK